jgi:hypothetical protein
MAGQGVPSGGSVPQTPEQFPDEVKNEVEREANEST